MSILLLGLLLFFGVHIAASIPNVRAAAIARTGENGWRGVVTINAIAGLGLVVLGWKGAPNTPLFAPSALAIQFAPLLITLSLILFFIGGLNLRGHVKRRLHHPMLIGAVLWSLTHLLANGGARETLLFGSFLAFSLYELASNFARGKYATHTPLIRYDLIGLLVGIAVAKAVLVWHQWLFAVPGYLPQ
ncbi:NnrU family protein [Niveibacterium sp.]|uniref:NnrU family protein n=1 Tax=Niveibacterium sp. TaxID=2017444 RepID=UPI0035AF3805